MQTFLAGAEIDPVVLRKQLKPAAVIGLVSFLLPFLASMAYALFVVHWTTDGSKIATGLTFGTISSLYGLTHHYINEAQYTALVTVVILTAVVPTIVAQAFLHPMEFVDPEALGVP